MQGIDPLHRFSLSKLKNATIRIYKIYSSYKLR